MNSVELAANAVTTISIVLAGRNSIHTWWTGIVGCLLFVDVFYAAKLYADVALQAFFIAASVAGWWQWRGSSDRPAPPVARASRKQVAAAIGLAALATSIYGGLLHRYTDAYPPFVDSAVLAFSVVAQWLLVARRVESWPLWLLVNTIAVPLYASRGLYITCALYAAYWINAVISWRSWARLAERTGPAAAPSS